MMPNLIALVGPTAVGKTEVSIRIAEVIGCEIVSVDSRLIYKGMDIGTAKPSADDQRRVRHHLIDVVEPTMGWSLAEYLLAARTAINDVTHGNKIPMLVGGTGQYMIALWEGWHPPPRPETSEIRESLERRAAEVSTEAIYEQLMEVDPVSAERIDPRNTRRVIRALEIYKYTGQPASAFPDRIPPPYRFIKVGITLPRDELYRRIDRRIDQMLADGWVEEVRILMDRGVGRDFPAMEAIGYRQIANFLGADKKYEDAVAEIRRLTRQFVRRQYNWFKLGDPTIRWFIGHPDVYTEIVDYLRGEMADGSNR